ncbi:MAG: hypothetical protein CVT67_06425 [Actinobacteria bacterium HGW-Actinobacteria-7]|nr:MAG: hypothetical protein CVT67_06425 [Actinobacteria bacterium HGW-Actinobacteria-7]
MADERTQRTDTAHMAERLWFITLSAIAAVILFAAVVVIAAASPATCESCHAVQTKALKASTHSSVTCADCHGGADTLGVLQSRLQVVDMTVRAVVGAKTTVFTPVDEARCLACHSPKELSKTTTRSGLIMNHRAPLAKGMSCVSCHPDSGHSAVSWPLGYSMDTCMACHSASPTDLSSCSVCHTSLEGGSGAPSRTTPWRVTHGALWEKTHGMGDLTTCKGCHEQSVCLKCHNTPVPHPGGYLSDHGPQVVAMKVADRTGCMKCHTRHSCDNCHGITMPHPRSFLKVHPTQAKKDRALCLRCHSNKSCEECHTKHIHPGLPEKLKKLLLANPVNVR